MKYLLCTAMIVMNALTGISQTMQASIGAGSSSTRVIIYIKPIPAVNGNISTLQFDVAVPDATTPIPTLTIIGVPTVGSGWIIGNSYTEGGFRHYEIATGAVFNVTIGAGVETPVMELEFSGGPTVASNVSLVTLPLAGSITGNALFFCSGVGTSVEGQLYYARAGTTVINNASYSGGPTSSATLGGVILPVNWLSFDVVKQGNDGLLNWAVANEDANHHYELQRSTNNTSYNTIATVNKSTNGSTAYNYTDAGITNLNASVLYYRIKQVDINGRISYSDTRTLRLDIKGGQINIFPNPVKDGFYVSIPFTNPDSRKVKLNLVNSNGQLISSRQITTAQASNYYFDIKDKNLAAGNYNLQIIFEEKIMDTKKLFVSQ
jgi:hypothetical protein